MATHTFDALQAVLAGHLLHVGHEPCDKKGKDLNEWKIYFELVLSRQPTEYGER